MAVFESPFGRLLLERHPPDPTHTLRAWNQADTLLLNACVKLPDWQNTRHLVVNDHFGALSCALLMGGVQELHWWHDSAMARHALACNLTRNQLSSDAITAHQMPKPPASVDYIWLQAPKQLDRLRWQLACLQKTNSAARQITIGLMTKYESPALSSCLDSVLTDWQRHRAEKKARLYTGHQWRNSTEQPELLWWHRVDFETYHSQLYSLPGVFSAQKIDVGGRLLAEHLPKATPKRVLDLGCGNGLLGLAALKRYPKAEVIFVDDSSMAVASARQTIAANLPHALDRCQFLWADGTQPLALTNVDLVLCNPPFHQQESITTQIARLLFRQAHQCLCTGGQLLVVANRHLPYQREFQKLFGGFQVLTATRKFTVYQMERRQRGKSSRRLR